MYKQNKIISFNSQFVMFPTAMPPIGNITLFVPSVFRGCPPPPGYLITKPKATTASINTPVIKAVHMVHRGGIRSTVSCTSSERISSSEVQSDKFSLVGIFFLKSAYLFLSGINFLKCSISFFVSWTLEKSCSIPSWKLGRGGR